MSALARLHHLLHLPFNSNDPPALTLATFSAWKSLIERAVMAQQTDVADFEALNEVIITLGEASQNEACLALAWWIRGNAHYFLDQPQQAIAAYEQAELLYAARQEPLQIARLHVGKVGALGELGRYEEALVLGKAAAQRLNQSLDEADQQRLITLINNSAINSENVGRYTEALDGYQQALAWWQHKRQGATHPIEIQEAEVEIARIEVNIGIAKTWLGLYAEAGQLFAQTRTQLERLLTGATTNEDIAARVADTQLRLVLNSVWLEMQANSAPAVISAALQRAYQHPLMRESVNATTLINLTLSEVEWRLANGTFREEDGLALSRAKTQLQQLGLAHETGYAEVLWGHALLQSKATDGAHAIEAARRAFHQTAAEAIARGDIETERRATLGEARAWRQSGNWLAARDVLQHTLNRIEQTQSKLVISDFRLGFLESKLGAYHELADLLLEQGEALAALDTVERTKARSLADLLAAKPTFAPLHFSDASQPQKQTEAKGLDQLNLTDATERIRDHERASARYRPDQLPMTLPVATACTQLPPGMLAINYAVLHKQVWAFLVTCEGLIAAPQPLGPAPDATEIATALKRVTSIGGLPLEMAQRFAAQQLQAAHGPLGTWHRHYVAPLQPWLSHYERVLFVPDGALALLPFACLFNNTTRRYLIEDHEITLVPSLAIWALIQQRIQHRRAGEVDDRALSVVALGYSCGGRLPHAVQEAKMLAQLAQDGPDYRPGTMRLLLEAEATRAHLWEAAQQAQLIYIATHGQYRSDLPALSYLELADGRLEAHDILDMALNAATVILSACETGAGKLTGNEMLGLVRAFLYAGARAVLATYWPVSDRATEMLMGHLMRHLQEGKSVASALRAAQCACIYGGMPGAENNVYAELAHPYFWGALMLNGTSEY